MKITIIADVLGTENNGTTTACMNLARFLKSQGDEVSIVCCDEDKRGIEGYYVVDTYNLGPIINYMVKKNNVALAKPDEKVIGEAIMDADIVHIMMPFSLGKKAAKLAVKLGKPITAGFHVQAENFTTHIGMMNFRLVNYITYRFFYRHLYRHADAVHYPSEFIRETFETKVKHKTNGYVISNGVSDIFIAKNVEKPEELSDRFVILYTGRYSREKSHKVLIRAVSKSRYKDRIQLIFAGQGPCDRSIRRCSKRHKIHMPIMKFFEKNELVNVIGYADLYCHPAEIEIEAIACLEAISCGLVPVIADSKRCATKQFAIDEINLFRCNNSTDLASKIDYWIENPSKKAERSNEYCGFAQKYNQEKCMKDMRKMMVDCIGGTG